MGSQKERILMFALNQISAPCTAPVPGKSRNRLSRAHKPGQDLDPGQRHTSVESSNHRQDAGNAALAVNNSRSFARSMTQFDPRTGFSPAITSDLYGSIAGKIVRAFLP